MPKDLPVAAALLSPLDMHFRRLPCERSEVDLLLATDRKQVALTVM